MARSSPNAAGSAPGKANAVEETYGLYREQLRAFFTRRTRKRHGVEDLVQDVYERLLRYRSEGTITSPLSYLFQVAWNVLKTDAQNLGRERRRSVSYDPVELARMGDNLVRLWVHDAEDAVAEEELEEMLDRLPRACKIALIRHRRDGYSYQQIADELRVSPNTVKDYIVKALNECRAYFAVQDGRR